MNAAKRYEIFRRLHEDNPEPKTELAYSTPFELLIAVILSAQVEEDGSIAVNVRDSSERSVDLGERFVVFRDGVGKNGEALAPVRSSVGLALTRSLLAVNTCRLSVDPSGGVGLRFSMIIPADLVAAN